MALSAPAATLSSLHSTTTTRSTKAIAPSSLSSLQLHFHSHLRRHFSVGNSVSLSPQRRRILPLVEAKKQTFSSFDELIVKSEMPVLVDFYATWCGPCQFMVPILEQVSATLKDKVQVVKIDTEKYPDIANKYNIEALPTFILFKDGEACDRFEGAFPADKLVQRIESALEVKS